MNLLIFSILVVTDTNIKLLYLSYKPKSHFFALFLLYYSNTYYQILRILADRKERTQLFIAFTGYLKHKKGISYIASGDLAGLSHSKVKNIRRGGSSPDKEHLQRLLEAYPELKHLEEASPFIVDDVQDTAAAYQKEEPAPHEEELEELRHEINALEKHIVLLYKVLFGDKALDVYAAKGKLSEEEIRELGNLEDRKIGE